MTIDNRIKKIAVLVCMLFSFSSLFSQQDGWTQKISFFEAREGAASFVINNKLYVGTGNDKNDLWEYDPAANVWTQKANLPAPGRSHAVGFSIGNKGYIATGCRTLNFGPSYKFDSLMRDVWEYNPAVNSWTKKADFAGRHRARAAAFVLNNKAYIGSGEDRPAPIMSRDYPNRVTSDFWVFDPIANTWHQIADIPMRRMNAIAFNNNTSGFVGMGFYNKYTKPFLTDIARYYPGDDLQDLWSYDPVSNTWAKKSDFPGGKRMGMSSFSIGDTTYCISGAVVGDELWTSNEDILKNDVWSYNTITDTWVQKPDFPDTAKRRYSIAAAMAGKGYFGTGGDSDLWEYAPRGNVLAVSLVSFTGVLQYNKVKLEWSVANEHGFEYYEIQKSADGIEFKKTGKVNAVNRPHYAFEENVPLAHQRWYYRLKNVDNNGGFIYSKTITLTSNKDVEITNFHPSPLKGNTGYLDITSAKTQKLQVIVTNIAGQQISTQAVNITAGVNQIPLRFDNIAQGIYSLQVINEKNSSNTILFIKK